MRQRSITTASPAARAASPTFRHATSPVAAIGFGCVSTQRLQHRGDRQKRRKTSTISGTTGRVGKPRIGPIPPTSETLGLTGLQLVVAGPRQMVEDVDTQPAGLSDAPPRPRSGSPAESGSAQGSRVPGYPSDSLFGLFRGPAGARILANRSDSRRIRIISEAGGLTDASR